jgi:hypothetical protein
MAQATASPYLRAGRLADVIAALQVMATSKRPEAQIKDWAKVLSQDEADAGRWGAVFREHPEFFLVYSLRELPNEPKVALRWRYANRHYDAETGIEYTPEKAAELEDSHRSRLTSKPLTSDAVGILMNTAIELHSRALEEIAAKRWWVPLLAAILGFVGAIIGALVSGLFKAAK